jgi:hypothetical protein
MPNPNYKIVTINVSRRELAEADSLIKRIARTGWKASRSLLVREALVKLMADLARASDAELVRSFSERLKPVRRLDRPSASVVLRAPMNDEPVARRHPRPSRARRVVA